MTKPLRLPLSCLVALVAVSAPASLWAAPRTVALIPPSGDNVAPAVLQAARELLKDHLQRTGAYTVVEPAGAAPTAEEPTAAQAAQVAAALGAEQAIVLRITHFGSSARIRLNAYAAGSGQLVYWDSTVISGGPDELDPIIQRLVHAMQIGKPVRDSAEIDTVTDKEMQNLNRRTANKSFGVHLFTLLPFNTAGGSFGAVPGGGIFWLYDARSWMADISLDLGGHSGNLYYDAAIGGYYPLLREDFTPYVGGVVRLAYMNLGGQGAGGITLQPTAGILLGRLSSVQLRAEVGYFFNTFGEYATVTAQDSESSPARQPRRDHQRRPRVLTRGRSPARRRRSEDRPRQGEDDRISSRARARRSDQTARARARTCASAAPARSSASAHSLNVAPVVNTSSTMRTRFPRTRAVSLTTNAPATSASRAPGPACPSSRVARVRWRRLRSSLGSPARRPQRRRAGETDERPAGELEGLVEPAVAQPLDVQRDGNDEVPRAELLALADLGERGDQQPGQPPGEVAPPAVLHAQDGLRQPLAVLEGGARRRKRERDAAAPAAPLVVEVAVGGIELPRQRATRADAVERVDREVARRAEQHLVRNRTIAGRADGRPDQLAATS